MLVYNWVHHPYKYRINYKPLFDENNNILAIGNFMKFSLKFTNILVNN